jgi:hypothetical protein
MKKNVLYPLCFLVLIACGNTKKGTTTPDSVPDPIFSSLPSCLQEQVLKIEKNQLPDAPVQIDEYEYQGKRVFLFTADCCDQYNIVFDENCKGICAPSGGIDGRGDRKCNGFLQEAKHVRLVYKKKN